MVLGLNFNLTGLFGYCVDFDKNAIIVFNVFFLDKDIYFVTKIKIDLGRRHNRTDIK